MEGLAHEYFIRSKTICCVGIGFAHDKLVPCPHAICRG